MPNIQLSIAPQTAGESEIELEALDVPTALAIADINVDRGDAEIWDGDKRLAKLTKRGGDAGTFWELG